MTAVETEFMAVALAEADAARAEGNDPYGAVVVRDEDAVTGHNQCVTSGDPTAHSEVMAIRNAAGKWGTTDLTGATLYTSFEPCPMCCGAILISGIRSIVIGARGLPGEAPLGDNTIERLLELVGELGSYTIRADVLAEEARHFYAQTSTAS